MPAEFKEIDKSSIPEYMHIYLELAGKNYLGIQINGDGYPKRREKF